MLAALVVACLCRVLLTGANDSSDGAFRHFRGAHSDDFAVVKCRGMVECNPLRDLQCCGRIHVPKTAGSGNIHLYTQKETEGVHSEPRETTGRLVAKGTG